MSSENGKSLPPSLYEPPALGLWGCSAPLAWIWCLLAAVGTQHRCCGSGAVPKFTWGWENVRNGGVEQMRRSRCFTLTLGIKYFVSRTAQTPHVGSFYFVIKLEAQSGIQNFPGGES